MILGPTTATCSHAFRRSSPRPARKNFSPCSPTAGVLPNHLPPPKPSPRRRFFPTCSAGRIQPFDGRRRGDNLRLPDLGGQVTLGGEVAEVTRSKSTSCRCRTPIAASCSAACRPTAPTPITVAWSSASRSCGIRSCCRVKRSCAEVVVIDHPPLLLEPSMDEVFLKEIIPEIQPVVLLGRKSKVFRDRLAIKPGSVAGGHGSTWTLARYCSRHAASSLPWKGRR